MTTETQSTAPVEVEPFDLSELLQRMIGASRAWRNACLWCGEQLDGKPRALCDSCIARKDAKEAAR